MKLRETPPTEGLVGIAMHDLLAFFIGERFWVDEEFIAEIVEIDGERVKIRSDQFNGWALKSELHCVPT
jgi:hypothetical protein